MKGWQIVMLLLILTGFCSSGEKTLFDFDYASFFDC